MPHDVAVVEVDEPDALHVTQDLARHDQTRAIACEVDLGDVAGDDRLRSKAEPCEEHLHLLRRRVLRLVEDDESLVQRSPAHEGERRDFDLTALLRPREALRRHELVERVIQRTEVRVDLFGDVTRQESEALAGFDGGPREDESADPAVAKGGDAHCDSQIRLSCAGRTDREHEVVSAYRFDIRSLVRGLRADALAAHGRRDDFAQL